MKRKLNAAEAEFLWAFGPAPDDASTRSKRRANPRSKKNQIRTIPESQINRHWKEFGFESLEQFKLYRERLDQDNRILTLAHLPRNKQVEEATYLFRQQTNLRTMASRGEEMTRKKVSPVRKALYGEIREILKRAAEAGTVLTVAEATRMMQRNHNWVEHERQNFARAYSYWCNRKKKKG